MPGGDGETAPSNGHIQGQFDDLLSLILARSRGEVENDVVENALSSIVAGHAPAPAPSPSSGKSDAAREQSAPQEKDTIIPDDCNYDDDSDYDDDQAKINAWKAASKKYNAKFPTAKQVATRKREAKKNNAERLRSIEALPLGKMGEKMLITFGDGPVPRVEVISAALLGARTSLQRAILDARALRRREKDNWHHARAIATMHRGGKYSNDEMKKATTGIQNSVVDNELLFRAMDGHGDHLRFDVSCGFDVSQLRTLFPEEMGAYQKWKEMHEAYTEKNGDDDKKTPEDYDDAALDDKYDQKCKQEESAAAKSGRLAGRLANFDARTNVMGGDWYLTFADVRRGSFLPRVGGIGKKMKAAVNYQREMQQSPTVKRGRGRPIQSRGSWNNLHPTSIIFLHWIGFDPKSALSPPNEETTQALGFLAYDFFGKIVEKAVSLRLDCVTSDHTKRSFSRSDSSLLELHAGDQIERENIDHALAQVDLSSLYSSSNIDLGKSSKIAQLYFGPGFEERLELEMDEIFGHKEKALSQNEMKTRKDEETIFSELPEVPCLLSSVTGVLDENKDGEQNEATKTPTSSSKKKIRTK